jgi:hypothetical protein
MEPVTNPWIKWALGMTAVWLVAVGAMYFMLTLQIRASAAICCQEGN